MSKFKNFFYILFCVTCFSQTILAENLQSQSTIYNSSIQWSDEQNKTKLLEQIPEYDDKTIDSLFDAYLNPGRFNLPEKQNLNQYNLQFLNALWGPIDNPFIKFPRPAKAFLFLQSSSETLKNKPEYYLAPILKSRENKNIYIFDLNHTQPLLLNDWVAEVQNSINKHIKIRFNICMLYGSLPSDSCNNKSYQDEVRDVEKKKSSNLSTEKNLNLKAKRQNNSDWHAYAQSFLSSIPKEKISIYETSILWADQTKRNVLLNSVTNWPSYNIIQENFAKLRNLRYFRDTQTPNFLRRISWLYPDDGCWTRVAAAIKDLFGPLNNLVNAYARPSKIFAFGNLCVNTANHPEGYVMWWFHTAPIVKDAATNQTYVLDPSINMYQPTPVEKWIAEISSNSGNCANQDNKVELFNICNGYGIGPFDSCTHLYSTEAIAMLSQMGYQMAERERQVELNRNADQVLGDSPPWIEKINSRRKN